MIVTREAIVAANAKTIWKTCFASLEFEKWDPDLEEISNKSSDECKDGTELTFVMKDGNVLQIELSNVKENESLTFGGGVLMGAVFGEGIFILTPDEDDSKTKVEYSFELRGCLGASILSCVNKAGVIEGTEHGLENIKQMSEEAMSESQN
jgi:hypothetical protein